MTTAPLFLRGVSMCALPDFYVLKTEPAGFITEDRPKWLWVNEQPDSSQSDACLFSDRHELLFILRSGSITEISVPAQRAQLFEGRHNSHKWAESTCFSRGDAPHISRRKTRVSRTVFTWELIRNRRNLGASRRDCVGTSNPPFFIPLSTYQIAS